MQQANTRPWLSMAWTIIIGFLLAGAAHGETRETDGMKTIVGSVWYRERMLLPPNAEILINLEEVARADAPSELISSTRFAPEGGQPWTFSLAYDPAKLHDKGRYVLRARIEADGRLLFTSTEHIPAFDRSPGEPLKIMVSRVAGRPAGENVPPAKPDASLTNTYWKLIELNGQPAALGAGNRELHMVLTTEGNRVQGFSGCNKFTGNYQRGDNQLHFEPLASTRMACITGMEQEKRFLDALGNIVRYALSGESLSLYDRQNQLILRFESVYLK
jgi:putative lipoprotein